MDTILERLTEFSTSLAFRDLPAEIVTAARTAKQFLTYAVGTPLQHAVAAALTLEDAYYERAAADLGAKRDRLCAGLEAAGLEVYRPAGTYFVNVDIRPLGEEDGVAFCWGLPERAGVVAVPTSVFFDDQAVGRPLVRFAFCKRDEVIDEGVARLRTLAPARDPR